MGDNGEHAHQLRLSVIRLRQAMQQVSAYADRIDSVAYKLDGHSAAEFCQGPPINVTGGEDPADYLERIRAGEERDTVRDHLQAAKMNMAEVQDGGREAAEIGATCRAIAHATIAQAGLLAERNRLVAESVELQREGLEAHDRAMSIQEALRDRIAEAPTDRLVHLVELPGQFGAVHAINPVGVAHMVAKSDAETYVDLRGHSEEATLVIALPYDETLRRLRGETGSAEEGEG